MVNWFGALSQTGLSKIKQKENRRRTYKEESQSPHFKSLVPTLPPLYLENVLFS